MTFKEMLLSQREHEKKAKQHAVWEEQEVDTSVISGWRVQNGFSVLSKCRWDWRKWEPQNENRMKRSLKFPFIKQDTLFSVPVIISKQ